MRVGHAPKPTTKVVIVLPYIEHLEFALIMTVEPGFGGRKVMISKVRRLR